MLENYINSFDFSKSTLCESLQKILRNLALKKDFILIDNFSKIFSKIYFNNSKNYNEIKYFNSENAMYMMTFILILLDLDFKLKGMIYFKFRKCEIY